MKDTPYHYGLISRVFHWGIGLLVLANLMVGLLMDDIPMPDKIQVIHFHKATGMVILALMALRLVWRVSQGFPKMVEALAPWQRNLARAAHIAFYPLLLAMPVSGWLMSSAAGYPVSVYGLFTLPALLDKNPELAKVFYEAHELLAYALMALLAAHIGAALYHHFVQKHKIIRRML